LNEAEWKGGAPVPENIDFSFLSNLEGGCRTAGYVPAEDDSTSGVTIATGFDLGQRSESELTRLGLSSDLVATLKPYLGKLKKDATDFLAKNPLTITLQEAQTIDKLVRAAHIRSVKLAYNGAVGGDKAKKKFDDLPAEAQTVIISVSFQYGAGLSFVAPKFWKAAVNQDWDEVSKILKNFGDRYKTRRNKEAALIDRIP
jgi:hypothetical protein